ncbi:hypothetical protein HN51_042138 [Arachis hypogaea]|nr:uncharacterized protein DS421_16g560000 [Arachis hypogaea]
MERIYFPFYRQSQLTHSLSTKACSSGKVADANALLYLRCIFSLPLTPPPPPPFVFHSFNGKKTSSQAHQQPQKENRQPPPRALLRLPRPPCASFDSVAGFGGVASPLLLYRFKICVLLRLLLVVRRAPPSSSNYISRVYVS